MTEYLVGAAEEFPEGKAKKIEIQGIEIAVFNVEGEYYGMHNNCPHKNLPLDKIGQEKIVSSELEQEGSDHTFGEINAEEGFVRCPWHFLKWDLETGYNSLLKKSIPIFNIKKQNNKLYIEM